MKQPKEIKLPEKLVTELAELARWSDYQTTIEGWKVSHRTDDGCEYGYKMYFVIQKQSEPSDVGWEGCVEVQSVGPMVHDETTFYKRKKKIIKTESWE